VSNGGCFDGGAGLEVCAAHAAIARCVEGAPRPPLTSPSLAPPVAPTPRPAQLFFRANASLCCSVTLNRGAILS
jgi:hypothetical protein